MQLPSIQIQQTHAKINLQSNRQPMQINQHHADMQISQKHTGLMQMNTTVAKLTIDQTEAFADANLKTPLRLSKEFLNDSKNAVYQYIAKTAQQTNQLMRIENGGEAIPSLAKQNSEKPEKQLTLEYMPKNMSRVKFNYQPSEVNINVQRSEPNIKFTPRSPDIQIPKWQTDVYVAQKNQISFEAVGVNVNLGL